MSILFKKFCLVLLLQILCFTVEGQNSSIYIPYKFPEKAPENFYNNRKEDYLKMLEKKPPSGLSKANYERFAQLVVYGKANMFLSGKVYLGWNELEEYLNQILQKILPVELINDKKLHIYPVRSASYNASTLHDGTIFFNIGLLADAENEASVAAVIAHEVSHYFNNDLEKSFISKTNVKKNKNKSRKAITFEIVHENRQREHIADTLGFRWALNVGYDITQAVYNFYRFLDVEHITKVKRRNSMITNVYVETNKDGTIEEKSLSQLLSSHPETKNRIDELNDFCKKSIKGQNLQKYIVKDEDFFKQLQQTARYESLHILMESMQYTDCIERAFLYHLFNPDNEIYNYYLLEALRRYLYLKPFEKNNGFLSEEYIQYFDNEDYNLLRKLNLLIRDNERLLNIAAEDFKDTSIVPFITNAEAFAYFSSICRQKMVKESFLTLALSAELLIQRDSLLTIYLSFNDISYKTFAQAMLKGDLYNQSYKKELILTGGVSFYNINRTGIHYNMVKSERESEAYVNGLSYLNKDFKNCEFQFVQQVMNKSYADAIAMKKSINSAAVVLLHQRYSNPDENALDLFILDPAYYDLFRKYELASLSFLVTNSYDDKRQIVNVVHLINPLTYLGLSSYFNNHFNSGTSRHMYEIGYLNYTPSNDAKLTFYQSSANYRLTKMNYLNAVYYSLIDE